jgi:hypothetical protein
MVAAGRANIKVASTAPGDAPGDLRREIRRGLAPAQPAEGGIDEGHHRVEVTAGDRAEHQDDRDQPDRGRRRVLQQLQPGLARRQPLRGDARADHHRGQERAARNSAVSRRHRTGALVTPSS